MGCGQGPFSKTHSQELGLILGGLWAQGTATVPQLALGLPAVQEADGQPGSTRAVGFSQRGLRIAGALLFVYSLKPGSWLPREKSFKNWLLA